MTVPRPCSPGAVVAPGGAGLVVASGAGEPPGAAGGGPSEGGWAEVVGVAEASVRGVPVAVLPHAASAATAQNVSTACRCRRVRIAPPRVVMVRCPMYRQLPEPVTDASPLTLEVLRHREARSGARRMPRPAPSPSAPPPPRPEPTRRTRAPTRPRQAPDRRPRR